MTPFNILLLFVLAFFPRLSVGGLCQSCCQQKQKQRTRSIGEIINEQCADIMHILPLSNQSDPRKLKSECKLRIQDLQRLHPTKLFSKEEISSSSRGRLKSNLDILDTSTGGMVCFPLNLSLYCSTISLCREYTQRMYTLKHRGNGRNRSTDDAVPPSPGP